MAVINIIHENNQWMEPLRAALHARNVDYREYFMDRGVLDLFADATPGVFFNKMSASSYTRDHRFAPDYTLALLSQLEAGGHCVINGSNALRLEISKLEQYTQLKRAGIRIPRTVAAFGAQSILDASEGFDRPFILKPNRGGKGIGVQLFRNRAMLKEYLQHNDAPTSVDDLFLLQDYIEAPDQRITRLEFIDAKLVYAVSVDTSEGFELCPAEACRVNEPAAAAETCAIGGDDNLFRIIPSFTNPLVPALEQFLRDQKIGVAGIEFITDREGQSYVYDLNMNTNYNPAAERKAGVHAMDILVQFLTRP